MFDVVEFGANDVRAVKSGKASRGMVLAILTSHTCGEACWEAREDICRCSCGGKNHGCLRVNGGARPERNSRIDGHAYKLIAVGRYLDLAPEARKINYAAGWKAIDKPYLVTAENAYLPDGKPYWRQYRYHWEATDHGAPARLKSATASQRNWQELSGWREHRHDLYLLWQRLEMPPRPTELAIDTETGLPLENQNPQ
jgi:hypothetical protein